MRGHVREIGVLETCVRAPITTVFFVDLEAASGTR